jgi:outer membrane protein OmpA-like peptidoglycan-associated protein/osmotically-inducible protein OsmY
MKCNPLRWLWGLVPLALLFGALVLFERDRIEADLRTRTQAAVTGAGLRWATATFEGRDALITGSALDETDPEKAKRVVRDVWGVRVADSRVALVEKAETYLWYASRAGNRIRLRGMVPNDATRGAIVGSARKLFAQDQVEDEMQLRRGVPSEDTWLTGINFALRQLGGLKTGEVRLEGLGLSVVGDAGTSETYRAIKTALQGSLPRNVKLINDRVAAPTVSPFTWNARFASGQMTLGGYVPSDRARDDIVTAAKAAVARVSVVDRMETAQGAPNGWTSVVIASLKELGRLEEGVAETRDAMLGVAGMASDEATADQVRRNLRSSMPQGFRLTDQIQHRAPVVVAPPPPQAKSQGPYVTTAAVKPGTVLLTGFAPSETARDAVAQQVRLRFPGRQVDNKLEIAPGAIDGWLRCIDSGLLGLARLGSGQLQMNDRRLDVAGATDDEVLAEAVPGDVKAATRGDCDANVRVDVLAEAPPELVWRAAFNGREVVLEGDVPGPAIKVEMVQAARSYFLGASVIDRMRVVDSRSRKWPRVADAGMKMLAELKSGEVRLARDQLIIVGEAADQGIVGRIRDRLGRELQTGYAGREQISVAAVVPVPAPRPQPQVQQPQSPQGLQREAQSCQDALRTAANDGIIRFARASAEIDRASTATLDKLSSIARSCPQVVIEVEGHTDAEGTPERKQRLSDRRAQAVLDYMARAGVDGRKLAAVGYADSRPIANNGTAEGRAKNRRIEFTVKSN